MAEWNIQARARACQTCGHAFQHGEAVHTLLFEEQRAYRRHDLCAACWEVEMVGGGPRRVGYISHWESRYDPPPPAPPEPIQKESAESLLRRLLEHPAPEYAGCRFILAVMLERKRLLKVKAQTCENGRRLLIYEHVRTGEVFTVPDPELRLDQLESVQRQVAVLLERGMPVEGATATAPEGAAPPPELDSTAAGAPSVPPGPPVSAGASAEEAAAA